MKAVTHMKAVTVPPIRSEAAAKAPPHDPAWVVQRAWSVFRLPRLQELIRLTIADLHSLPRPKAVDPGLDFGSEPRSIAPGPIGANPAVMGWAQGDPMLSDTGLSGPVFRDPVSDALRACCDELRDASGMSGARSDRIEHCQVVRDYMQQQPPTWSLTFSRALDEYRRAAAVALEATLARASVAS